MAVSAVWRLVCFLAPSPWEPKEQTAAHRRDALCPSTKIQKQAAFGITQYIGLGVVDTEGFGLAGEVFARVVEVNNVDSSGKVG
jgi:hypothetical protein